MNTARPGRRRGLSHPLSCPRCGMRITPPVNWLAIEHCPRCLAHARVAVALISSPTAAENMCQEQFPTLRADRPDAQAVDRRRPR
jgi:hypothetical protein